MSHKLSALPGVRPDAAKLSGPDFRFKANRGSRHESAWIASAAWQIADNQDAGIIFFPHPS
jgi:hypothetical protein